TQVIEAGVRHPGARGGHRPRLLAHLELRAKVASIELEERVALLDRISRADEDFWDDARDRRADGDVLRACLRHPDGGHRVAKIRDRRRRGGIRALTAGGGTRNRVGGAGGGEQSDQRQKKALHPCASVRGSLVTFAIFPSSIWAMLCA